MGGPFRGGFGAGPLQLGLGRGMLLIMIVTSAVFVLCMLRPALIGYLILTPQIALRHFALWQPLTALFTHVDFRSFLIDMLMFWLIGSFVERSVGRRETLALFLVSGVGGYLVAAVVGLWLAPHTPFYSANPALFAMIMMPAFLFGRRNVLALGVVPGRADVISIIFALIWLISASYSGGIPLVAGDLAGALAAWLWTRRNLQVARRMGGTVGRVRLWWLRRRYKVLQGGKGREDRGRNEKRWLN